jgi:hypothetical protein
VYSFGVDQPLQSGVTRMVKAREARVAEVFGSVTSGVELIALR